MAEKNDDRKFMCRAIEEARKCEPEDDRVHPCVGAIVVRNGKELGAAYRNELKDGQHAEHTVLETKLGKEIIAGCTVYTTLEPCTTRKTHTPCAELLGIRRVSRVVIGMLDPNQAITGKGVLELRERGIAVDLFPPELMREIEELNRHFIKIKKEESEYLETWIKFREKLGIVDLCENARDNTGEIRECIKTASDLKIMGVTARSAIFSFRDAIITAMIEKNCSVKVLVAKRDSEFVKDIEVIEGIGREGRIPGDMDDMESMLRIIADDANAKGKSSSSEMKHILLRKYNTEYRAALIICKDSLTNDTQAWYTPNLPPRMALESVSFRLREA